jgi:hypothetical protein
MPKVDILDSKDPFLGLKLVVKSFYDIQEQRIANGNRLVAQFKGKMGYTPGKKEQEVLDKEAKKILADLKDNYKKLTDGVKDVLPKKELFKGEGVISTYAEGVHIQSYVFLEREEARMLRQIGDLLEDHPLWNTFLADIHGVGVSAAGAIIASIDITKAEYPSSLWKYCGYDVVRVGRNKKKPVLSTNKRDVEEFEALLEDESTIFFQKKEKVVEMGFTSIDDLDWTSEGRGRRKGHMVDRAIVDQDGDLVKSWQSLSYNPWIKSKLWVLATSFLRSGNEKYTEVYYNRRNHTENSPDWKDSSKGHRHSDALRVMIKRFLVDLYNAWRPLEGLPVAPEYSEAKLGLIHKSAKKYAKAA